MSGVSTVGGSTATTYVDFLGNTVSDDPKRPGSTGFGAGNFDPNVNNTLSEALGLPQPTASFSQDQLVILMQALKAKNDDNQLKGSSQDVQIAKLQKQSAANERLDQLKEMADKGSKAAKDGVLGKVFGWIAAAAMVIAGAVLLATGVGAAAGVALLAGGVMMMATMALQETGGMDKMMNGLSAGLTKMFEAFGMPPDQAEKAGRITATVIVGTAIIAAAVAASVFAGPGVGAMMVASFLPLVLSPDNLEKMGMDKDKAQWASFGISIGLSLAAAGVGIGASVTGAAGRLGTQIAEMSAQSGAKLAGTFGMTTEQLQNFGRIAAGITEGIQATAMVGGGAATIDGAVNTKEAADAQAKAKELQADLLKLQQLMQDESDRIDEIIKRLQEVANVVMDVLNQTDTTNKRIASV